MSFLRLERIHLVNFKNYAEAVVDFKGTLHCFLGKNGSGKTNLLEAIHYLAFTKAGSQASDASNARHGENHFHIKGSFERKGKREEVMCSFSTEKKKSFFENGKEYSRLSDHIGKYPLVSVAPGDIELIWDGGEVRRKFFDTLLSQLDKEYLENLIVYQSQLRQRNSLLKIFSERGSVDHDLIDTYDERIVSTGTLLFHKRKDFSERFLPPLVARYDFLVKDGPEKASLQYQSDLERIDFKNELKEKLERDMAIGRTMTGVHRDDFLFTLDGYELKRYGSQGQQKSFLIALKLAEFDCLAERNGFKPLLLLDDIFDKLDDDRIRRLMELMVSGTFGQVFLTDARPERSTEILSDAGVTAQLLLIENGAVREA